MQILDRQEHSGVFERLTFHDERLRQSRRTLKAFCDELESMNGTGEPLRNSVRQQLKSWADGKSRQAEIR